MSTFTPAPGAAPFVRQVTTQASMEARLMLRNGEQLLLAVVIPVIVLVGGVRGAERVNLSYGVDTFAPGVLALAIMSTSFTSLAIATGFERRGVGALPQRRGGRSHRVGHRVDDRAVELPALPVQRYVEVHIGRRERRIHRPVQAAAACSGYMPHPRPADTATRSPRPWARSGRASERLDGMPCVPTCPAVRRRDSTRYDGANAAVCAVKPSDR